jgi:hypothetical protein
MVLDKVVPALQRIVCSKHSKKANLLIDKISTIIPSFEKEERDAGLGEVCCECPTTWSGSDNYEERYG